MTTKSQTQSNQIQNKQPKIVWNSDNSEGHYPVAYEFRNTELRRGDKIVSTDISDCYDTDTSITPGTLTPVLVYNELRELWITTNAPSGECYIYPYPTYVTGATYTTQMKYMDEECGAILPGGTIGCKDGALHEYVGKHETIHSRRSEKNSNIYEPAQSQESDTAANWVTVSFDREIDDSVEIIDMVISDNSNGFYTDKGFFLLCKEKNDPNNPDDVTYYILNDYYYTYTFPYSSKIKEDSFRCATWTPHTIDTDAFVCLSELGEILLYAGSAYLYNNNITDYTYHNYSYLPYFTYNSTKRIWKNIDFSAYTIFAIDIYGNLWMRGGKVSGVTDDIPDSVTLLKNFHRINFDDCDTNPFKKISFNRMFAVIRNDGIWCNMHTDSPSWGEPWFYENDNKLEKLIDGDFIDVSVRANSVLALRSDGTLWYVGANYNIIPGGDSFLLNPVQVGTDNDWIYISNKRNPAVAIKSDGTLWVAGYNNNGCMNYPINDPDPGEFIKINDDTDWVRGCGGNTVSYFMKKNSNKIYGCGANFFIDSKSVEGCPTCHYLGEVKHQVDMYECNLGVGGPKTVSSGLGTSSYSMTGVSPPYVWFNNLNTSFPIKEGTLLTKYDSGYWNLIVDRNSEMRGELYNESNNKIQLDTITYNKIYDYYNKRKIPRNENTLSGSTIIQNNSYVCYNDKITDYVLIKGNSILDTGRDQIMYYNSGLYTPYIIDNSTLITSCYYNSLLTIHGSTGNIIYKYYCTYTKEKFDYSKDSRLIQTKLESINSRFSFADLNNPYIM
jgi:hypothetical protein